MKRFSGALARRSTWVLAVAMLVVAGAATPASAQDDWTPGRYMQQALGKVMGMAMALDSESSFGYVGDGVCIMASFVRINETCAFDRPLRRGQAYAFLAAGDDDARDVDLEVLDSRGNVVVEDTSTDATASIRFTPNRDDTYSIRVKLYDSADNSFCAVAIMEDGGINVPKQNVFAVAERLFEACEIVAERASREDLSTGFLTESNQVAIYGMLLSGDEYVQINNITLGGESTAIVAVGDTQVEDIDLHLYDSNEKMIDEDVDLDANPLIILDARPGQTYGLRTSNAARNSPRTLVLTGILQMHD